MPRIARVHPVIARRARRATQWIASTVETGATTLGANTAVLDQTFAFGEKATVIRVRGELYVKSDQLAGTENALGAVGMAVVTNQAAAIGITAVPTPITDQASDNWFLWQPIIGPLEFGDATGFSFNPYTRYIFESKAMRKVDDGDTVAVVLENSSTVHGLRFILMFRMLVKLHA